MRVAFASEFDGAVETKESPIHSYYPLVLDLDGTLLRTDLLFETALEFLRRDPLGLFKLLFWACGGIAHLKHKLAACTELAIDLLPINEALVSYARNAADQGRLVVAATAASRDVAIKVCTRFSFITEVMASSSEVNLKGAHKAKALRERFPAGYAYAGDAASDLQVWQDASYGLFAGTDQRLLKRLQQITTLEADFSHRGTSAHHWLRALRIHQWAKNALVFLPLMLAGHLLDLGGWGACLGAFLATGLTASATYIVNDLLDLQADRRHWSKRDRPLASGRIAIPHAAFGAAALLSAGLGLAALTGGGLVLGTLLLYCVLTLGYSLHVKRVPILDVVLLAALFTMRLGIGAVAAHVRFSSWLGVFSMFLFLSLALAKRSTELVRNNAAGAASLHGRGYVSADAPLITSLGVSSAIGAVLLMVLYLVHDAFGDALYRSPQLLWAVPVLIGLWLGRIWLLCGRGSLHDDPVAFAVADRISIWLGFGVLASFGSAALVA